MIVNIVWRAGEIAMFSVGIWYTGKAIRGFVRDWRDRRQFNKETDRLIKEMMEKRKEDAELQASGEDQLKEESDQGGPEVSTPGE